MSFAPNYGTHYPLHRSNAPAGLNGSGPKNNVRTDFSGLFPTGRVRTRNNSQTQKPVTLMLSGGSSGNLDPWPSSSELQFPVDEDPRDIISCEKRERPTGNGGWSQPVAPSVLQNTGFLSATTRRSFDILTDDSAEAFEFFEAAANSGIEFGSKQRQRHFSLEEYNELADQFSGNESSNESFAVNKQSTKFGGLANMQVDEPEGYFGTETPSTPSTPSTGGLGLPNAFTFPVSNLQSKNAGNSVTLDTDAEHISAQLHTELKHRLLSAIEEKSRKVVMQFPANLIQEIAAHVIQEASLEPCGLKGCVIHIYFEGENDCQYMNTLRCDPVTIPTFELTLTLRQNQPKIRGWIPDIVKRNFAVMPNIMVSTSYRLVKRRKYRLNEIEELNLQ